MLLLLPPELFVEVFAWCAANDPLALLTIQKVSKSWSDLVLSSKRLWQHILLDSNTHSLSFLIAQAKLWIRRSEPISVDVELDVESHDHILPLLSPLLPHFWRWHSFTLCTEFVEERVIMADVNPLTIPLIELHITIQDDPREFTLKTFEAFPQKSSMQLYILHLPTANLVAPLWMTTLKISEDSLSNFHCSPKDILIFLSACPLLQVFSFRGWHHNEPPSPDDYHLPVVKLLHLHTLQLKNTCMTRAILSHLDTPRLVNLNLEHLNTEFALEGEYQEEGDSDDEANDFSQSPSTDRATGMGLRNLIKRCNPPIRTLNMDYSDLRTKDFEFVFDKLRWLEEFRIVASDMSDSVISLFRPYTLSGEQTPRIRLPQLRLLSLYNCNRLSGDAVVDALSERETYTNHPSTWAQPLNNVRIFTCDRIHSEHAEKLTQLLGTRLQVQLV